MKSIFRTPGPEERILQFHGWRINNEFRISLLDGCGFNNVSLAKAAKLAEVDFDVLNKFMKGEDGLLEYVEMQRLLVAVSPHISFITLAVDIENITCNSPSPDELSDYDRKAHESRLDWSWQHYSKRGMKGENDE